MIEKKIRTLKTKEEAVAFMSFLAAERNRHIKDVQNAEDDMKRLSEKWDIEIPWDNTYFVVV